jgi:COP9 signalosome complex subunit 1
MGNEDLGNHYFAIGDLSASFKAYSRMREFCTTPKHIAEMTLKLLHVSIAQANWVIANSYNLKISALNLKEEERAKYLPILHACSGLANLQQGNYRDAAVSFLAVDPSYMTPEQHAGIVFQRQVLTPNDIAVYGGLCALATMDRSELQRRVLDNTSFRQFLELEPHIRRAITMFCSSKYSNCLSKLAEYTADYLLDFYLSDHFPKLFGQIRSKSIVQWFSAYSVVTLEELEKAFPVRPGNEGTIVNELARMIRDGTLDARIDFVDKVCFPSSLPSSPAESKLILFAT